MEKRFINFMKSTRFILLFAMISLTSISASAEGLSGELNPCLGEQYTYNITGGWVCTNTVWDVQGGTIVSQSNYSITIVWTSYNAGVEVLSGCSFNGHPYQGGIDLAITPQSCEDPCAVTKGFGKPNASCGWVRNNCDVTKCIQFTIYYTSGGSYTQTVSVPPHSNHNYCCSGQTVSSIIAAYVNC